MARREYTEYVTCVHEGCKETSFYSHRTRKEYSEGIARRKKFPWKCCRHSGGHVVSPKDTTVNFKEEFVAEKSNKYPELPMLFWSTGSGFVHGNNWKAYAEDFPKGSKVIVETTIRVIVPDVDN